MVRHTEAGGAMKPRTQTRLEQMATKSWENSGWTNERDFEQELYEGAYAEGFRAAREMAAHVLEDDKVMDPGEAIRQLGEESNE